MLNNLCCVRAVCVCRCTLCLRVVLIYTNRESKHWLCTCFALWSKRKRRIIGIHNEKPSNKNINKRKIRRKKNRRFPDCVCVVHLCVCASFCAFNINPYYVWLHGDGDTYLHSYSCTTKSGGIPFRLYGKHNAMEKPKREQQPENEQEHT